MQQGQRALRDSLKTYFNEIPELAKEAPEFELIKKLMGKLGWRPESPSGKISESTDTL